MKPCYREYFPGGHVAPRYTDVLLQYPIQREGDLRTEKPG